jgi:hypothetical protein
MSLDDRALPDHTPVNESWIQAPADTIVTIREDARLAHIPQEKSAIRFEQGWVGNELLAYRLGPVCPCLKRNHIHGDHRIPHYRIDPAR